MATVTAAPPLISAAGFVILRAVSWEMYCQLRDEEANNSVRMTYLDGDLILMSPEMRHDHLVELLTLLVRAVASACGWEIKGIRTTTLRLGADPEQSRGSAKEADAAFYIGANEGRMRRRNQLDLNVDPPPDLAIEVENTSGMTAIALSIYARLRVPEIWRFRAADQSVVICCLDVAAGAYVVRGESQIFPGLTPALIRAALARYDVGDIGEIAWSEWLRAWARDLPEAGAEV